MREAGGHRGVVGAVLPFGEDDLGGQFFQAGPKGEVGGDAAAEEECFGSGLAEQPSELFFQDVETGGLETGGNVGLFLFGEIGGFPLEAFLAEGGIEDGGFEARERHL